MSGDADNEYTADVLKTLYQQAQNKKFTDFEIRAGNKRVACHRAVVSAKSEYFDSICSSGLNEAVLEYASDEHGHFLDAIVKFMYLGKTELTLENVESMLLAADFIKHADLKRYCEEFMSNNLTVENFVSYQKLSTKVHSSWLKKNCVRLSKEQFTSIVKTDWFTSLSVDEVRDYLRDDDLVVENEDDVMEAVHRWLQSTKVSASVKEAYVEKLFPCVRLRYCRESTLQSMSKDKTVMSCMKLKIFEFLQHGQHGDGSARKSYSSTATAAPITEEQVLIVGGLKANNEIHRNIVLLDQDPDSSVLTQPPLCVHAITAAACATEDGLIMSGGYNRSTKSTMKTVQIFRLSDRSWRNLPDLTQPLRLHGSAYVDRQYYTFGGLDTDKDDKQYVLASVMKLDLNTMSWSECQSLPLAVHEPGAAVVKSNVFVVAGYTGEYYTTHVSKYSTQTGRRTSCAPIPEAVTCGFTWSTTAVNKMIFVLSHELFLQYDTTNDQWTKLHPPIKPSQVCAMVHKQGHLVVLGGYEEDWDHPNDRVQTYDLTKKTWVVEKRTMPVAVCQTWALVMKVPKSK